MSLINSTLPTIHYPFATTPDSGQWLEIAAGVYWLRMPLPIYLNHINLWLIEGEQGFTIIDTGWATDETLAVWQAVQTHLFKTKRVERLLATHMHPDHIGFAGWLAETYQVELCMSRAEYLSCHLLLSYTHEHTPPEAIQFYRAAGYDEQQLQKYRAHFGQFGQYVRSLPHAYRRLKEGDRLTLGSCEWQVVIGAGHSPEHVCLYNAEQKLFIAGDQLLPTISSNVSVWPTEPQANPLEDWLQSCQHLHAFLPEDTLILPSHGHPFYGAHERLNTLMQESETSLEKLLAFCQQPRRAVDTFPVLFNSQITSSNLMMATGESLAHLHCLQGRGLVQVEYRDGVGYWQACS